MSSDADTNFVPSFEKLTLKTALVWFLSVAIFFPNSALQTWGFGVGASGRDTGGAVLGCTVAVAVGSTLPRTTDYRRANEA